jgi:transposase
MCKAAGVHLKYLPPYSPDFNPIEQAFAELKGWMRRNYEIQNDYETLKGFLDLALRQHLGKQGNHFCSSLIATAEILDEIE